MAPFFFAVPFGMLAVVAVAMILVSSIQFWIGQEPFLTQDQQNTALSFAFLFAFVSIVVFKALELYIASLKVIAQLQEHATEQSESSHE
jgi:hypothetical protein